MRRLLTLQGTVKPHQIITLMHYPGTDNTLVAARPLQPHPRGLPADVGQSAKLGKQVDAILKPGQWTDLIARLGQIKNPTVRRARRGT